jgi:hypothetical protein
MLKDDEKSKSRVDPGMFIGIEKVLELSGVRRSTDPKKKVKVYAHLARPLGKKEYAFLAIPSKSFLRLGFINPDTRLFDYFEPRLLSPFGLAKNGVVNRIFVYKHHLDRIQTLDEILAIKGIKEKKTFVPVLPADIKEILGKYKEIYYKHEPSNFKYVSLTLYTLASFEEDKGHFDKAMRLKRMLSKYIGLLKTYPEFRKNEFVNFQVDMNESVTDYINKMAEKLRREAMNADHR